MRQVIEGRVVAPADCLWAFVESELRAIPLSFWGFFFPCVVAAWRFVEENRPGELGQLDMSLATDRTDPPSELRVTGRNYVITRRFGVQVASEPGPSVFGKGAGLQWFTQTVMSEGPAFDAIEGVMYFVAEHLSPEQLQSESLGHTAVARPPGHLLETFAAAITPAER